MKANNLVWELQSRLIVMGKHVSLRQSSKASLAWHHTFRNGAPWLSVPKNLTSDFFIYLVTSSWLLPPYHTHSSQHTRLSDGIHFVSWCHPPPAAYSTKPRPEREKICLHQKTTEKPLRDGFLGPCYIKGWWFFLSALIDIHWAAYSLF